MNARSLPGDDLGHLADAELLGELRSRSESVLLEAESITNGQRRVDYGGVLESFERIARLWSEVIGVAVSAEQVALCMVQLKVSRWIAGQQRDSLVDIAGYAGCMDNMSRERSALTSPVLVDPETQKGAEK